jgi:hypothetical protein
MYLGFLNNLLIKPYLNSETSLRSSLLSRLNLKGNNLLWYVDAVQIFSQSYLDKKCFGKIETKFYLHNVIPQ